MAYDQKAILEVYKFLGNILKTKSMDLYQKHIEEPDFDKYFNRFLILRHLSMSKDQRILDFVIDNQLALGRFPSNYLLYLFLINSVPKQTSSYIEFLKRKKK
jgi:hypothetical protein